MFASLVFYFFEIQMKQPHHIFERIEKGKVIVGFDEKGASRELKVRELKFNMWPVWTPRILCMGHGVSRS